jgi:lipoyl(octanoyl) transferase
VSEVAIRELGRRPMRDVWADMQVFTERRDEKTPDEIWFVEHPPVYTLGLNASRDHLLSPGDIEVVQTDRGGQVTYHAPGQLVCYVLIDVKRRGLGIRDLVELLENAVIATVARYGVVAAGRRDAPGVYVEGAKLAAIGLRVRRGCSYHGIAINVAMDLEPFERINPCGFEGLSVTQLSELCEVDDFETLRRDLGAELLRQLGETDAGD